MRVCVHACVLVHVHVHMSACKKPMIIYLNLLHGFCANYMVLVQSNQNEIIIGYQQYTIINIL